MRSGFVAVVGKPNVGKSTLLNALTGKKISIVSEKPQTTRFKLRGILHWPEAQIILVDTPGFHQPKDALGEYLNSQVVGTIREVDLILFLVDASREITEEDNKLAQEITRSNLPCLLVLTKKDLVQEEKIKSARESIFKIIQFQDWIAVSASTGQGLEELISKIIPRLPEGPGLYPEDMVTDSAFDVQAAEIIREKVLNNIYQEVPHAVAVDVLRIEENPEKKLLKIYAEIYVEKASQRKIVIGQNGGMIKKIGTQAREELEYLTGKKIFLSLQVKVKEKWRDKESFIRRIYRSS